MNVFVVCCHPEPKSFNHAMFSVARDKLGEAGHQVKTSDLYRMEFDPMSGRKNFTSVADPDYLKLPIEEAHATEVGGFAPEIEAEIRKLEWCDLMIWQFPLWWFGMPAGLKGWIDRVFARRRVYGHRNTFEKGVLRGKKAMLSFTTGVSEQGYQPGGPGGDILQIVKPIHYGVLQFTGFGVLAPHCVYSPIRMSDQQRESELNRYAERITGIFSEPTLEVLRF